MKHVSILVPKSNAILSSVIGPYKIFNAANEFLAQTENGAQPPFDIHLVGVEKDTVLYDGAFSIHCDKVLSEVERTDLILIPSFKPNDLLADVRNNQEFVPWIKKQRLDHGAEVASFCLGAFILAETGLVDGKQCATHWAGTDVLKKMYPKINVVSNKVVTEEDGLYTSGGAYSFLNLVVHLIEKYCGRDTAIFISKFFEIEIDRESQNQFAIFQGQKDHEDQVIKQAQRYIEGNVADKISVQQLAGMYSVSRRNFVRRFKKATQNTPLEYIQRVKIEAAKKRLESTQHNVAEVMFGVGYSDQKAFRSVFKKYVGLSPVAYKSKYNRDLVDFESPTTW
ncbi:helix-turn-helix domain-containing protein [Flavobacteriaceae bacterium 3-367]|uniref:GlxA family transcriptional regulator n=1 Tax=Eudoraea algarum TaxID=3417568 RepID=UPI00327DEAAC